MGKTASRRVPAWGGAPPNSLRFTSAGRGGASRPYETRLERRSVELIAVLGRTKSRLRTRDVVRRDRRIRTPHRPARARRDRDGVRGRPRARATRRGPVPTLDAPVIVAGAAPDGRWVAVCEASRGTDGNGRLAISVGPRGELRGDRLERSLRLSNGRVLPIDDLLATSADGRWVVVRRANAVELFDTSEGALLALDDGVDARRTEPTRTAHRTLVFRDGALLYVRERGREHVVVERSLETGTERVVYSAREPVVRVTADAFGAVDVVELAGPDRNGNGRFDWAFPPSADPLPCGGPITTVAAARARSEEHTS